MWGLALACACACSSSGADTIPSLGSGGNAPSGSGGSGNGEGGAKNPESGGAPPNAGGSAGATGATQGGSANGGRANGGSANGGRVNGGSANGGKANATGGKASVGAGGVSSSGGSGTGGSSTASADELCARWKSDRQNLTEDAWTGNASSCTAGDMSATSRDTVLRLVNLYRYIAELPAVAFDATRNQQDQACALMMQANGAIDHSPPSDWDCYSADGATAAGSSNLAGTGAIAAVDGYMLDPGNATTLGHRRWILSNSLGPIGVGSTGRYSCMWTLNGSGKAGKAWMAWPSPGPFPLQAFATSRQSIDTTGWSLQSDSVNLAGAGVTVTFNGESRPVTVTQLDPNYGSRYALRINPMGWTSAVGKYHVSVSGIASPIEYDIDVVSCN